MFATPKPRPPNGGVSLTVTLAASIGTLVLIAVIAVLGLGLWSASQNTISLLRDKAHALIDSTVERVSVHLDASRHQVAFVARMMRQGRLDPNNQQQFIATMTGALAAAPQISALTFIDTANQRTTIVRTFEGTIIQTKDETGSSAMRRILEDADASGKATWGEPLWLPDSQVTIINLQTNVNRDGKPLGILIASVTVRELSAYLGGLDSGGASNVFILYDRRHALAHPNLASGVTGRTEAKPLASLAETGDPILAAIWQRKDRYPLFIAKDKADFQGHVLDIFDDRYIYFYRNVKGYGAKDWQIGAYFRAQDINTEMRRLSWAALAGLVTLILALLTAIALARWIARPIVQLAGAASRIGKLEISETEELNGSLFRELNDQARSFNTMLQALRWFEVYVPKKLVSRLIRSGEAELPASEEREVTVMFTDIAGFTGQSEGITAPELAAFLNHHFALLARCIEDEAGTVDKFIGDSVMAFWGAPDEQPDHAERAVRAAQAIQAALASENEERASRQEAPIAVRVGLHSGPVTVGNIGAPGRINYTIVGDTVNIGQRLEQLGKQFAGDAAGKGTVTVLASGATVDQLAARGAFKSVGQHQLRGRDNAIEVFQLR